MRLMRRRASSLFLSGALLALTTTAWAGQSAIPDDPPPPEESGPPEVEVTVTPTPEAEEPGPDWGPAQTPRACEPHSVDVPPVVAPKRVAVYQGLVPNYARSLVFLTTAVGSAEVTLYDGALQPIASLAGDNRATEGGPIVLTDRAIRDAAFAKATYAWASDGDDSVLPIATWTNRERSRRHHGLVGGLLNVVHELLHGHGTETQNMELATRTADFVAQETILSQLASLDARVANMAAAGDAATKHQAAQHEAINRTIAKSTATASARCEGAIDDAIAAQTEWMAGQFAALSTTLELIFDAAIDGLQANLDALSIRIDGVNADTAHITELLEGLLGPRVNAGPDTTACVGSKTKLFAAVSSIMAAPSAGYVTNWRVKDTPDGGAYSFDSDRETAIFSGAVSGTYVLAVIVTDPATGLSASDEVTVTVPAQPDMVVPVPNEGKGVAIHYNARAEDGLAKWVLETFNGKEAVVSLSGEGADYLDVTMLETDAKTRTESEPLPDKKQMARSKTASAHHDLLGARPAMEPDHGGASLASAPGPGSCSEQATRTVFSFSPTAAGLKAAWAAAPEGVTVQVTLTATDGEAVHAIVVPVTLLGPSVECVKSEAAAGASTDDIRAAEQAYSDLKSQKAERSQTLEATRKAFETAEKEYEAAQDDANSCPLAKTTTLEECAAADEAAEEALVRLKAAKEAVRAAEDAYTMWREELRTAETALRIAQDHADKARANADTVCRWPAVVVKSPEREEREEEPVRMKPLPSSDREAGAESQWEHAAPMMAE